MSGQGSVTLRRWRRDGIDLEAALKLTLAALGEGAVLIGLCSAPAAWKFARIVAARDELALDFGGPGALRLREIFDLRAFVASGAPASAFELRWRRTDAGGRAAWLTARQGFDPTPLGAAALPPIEGETEPSARLLFGERERDAAPEGWAALREARIGEVRVPAGAESKQFSLTGFEVIAREPRFGNAHVAEEMLTGIGSAQPWRSAR